MLSSSNINPIKRCSFVVLSAVILSVNINTFVHTAGLLPGGFTGLTLLITQTLDKFFGITLPFSVIFIFLNLFPAILCFKYIGKWFTLFSFLNIVLSGFFTDLIPSVMPPVLTTHDYLLCAIFGGLINAVAISLCLLVDATSGGTDFIAIYLAEKRGKDAWGSIFAGNIVILAIAGCLFTVDKALYSIIFQFTTTMALGALYHGYQQRTLLIITEKPDEVYTLIRDKTHHDATSFKGIGHYKMSERTMLYSVVAANDVHELVSAIREIDPAAFINILKTERLAGKFFRRPKD